MDGEPLPERYFSDHATVICKLSLMRPAPRIKHAEFRKLKSIDITKLRKASRNSQLHQDPPDDLNMLLDCYNTTFKSLLDEHAPVCSRHVITRSRPPLFNDNIIQARRDRRKAERRWRKTRLPSDLVVFKVKRNYVVHLMNEARCTHYRPFIDKNSSDQSKLFRASKSLLNLQEDKSLSPHTNASVLANEMGEYFIHKVVAISSKLAGEVVPHAVSTECAPHGSSSTDDVVTLSEFQSLSEEAVRKMAVASMKTCALDPFPSSILLLCIEELLPVITRMLNISLKHGYFADEWKKALVHPPLKKSGLQLINKNFRPVSNLQFTSKLTEKAVAVQLREHM